ncbi:hypothetical protein E1286_26845 [Nonomuraea terrae]|uniref:SCP domain-containing protein n=1 Tax=Nonomuraea terrae TaxID=2530383 RepID=A0A4R4YHY3_9ACTN|nr:CAP domain-containing protein [Nonomuraea terrae]TDD44498.1 hypothetical protein E1286_26845 [Nonomuraea terrae]
MSGSRPALPDATNGAFLLQALQEANARRAAHHVPPLAMDPLLVEYARARAAARSEHEGLPARHDGPRAGTAESLFWSEGEPMRDAADAVASWDAEPGALDRLVAAVSTRMGAARAAGQGSRAYETYVVFVFEPL